MLANSDYYALAEALERKLLRDLHAQQSVPLIKQEKIWNVCCFNCGIVGKYKEPGLH